MRKCYVNTAFVFKAVLQLASFSLTGSKGKPCVFLSVTRVTWIKLKKKKTGKKKMVL